MAKKNNTAQAPNKAAPLRTFSFIRFAPNPIIALPVVSARVGAIARWSPGRRLPMNPNDAISAILPVRNEEAAVERAVASLAAQPEIREILVVNDQSTDGTARVLYQLAATEPKLRLLDAGPLPPGWVGKNHAAWQGAQKASEPWLLFTDADAVHLPGSAARALADAAATGAAMISYSPAQELHTWWERALIPFVFCRLSELYSYAAVNDPQSPAAAANGQYLLVR